MHKPTRREVMFGLGGLFFGAGALGVYSVASGPAPAERVNKYVPPAQGELPDTAVYASEETRRKFPAVDNIADWTNKRIDVIYAIAPEDFKTETIQRGIEAARGANRGTSSVTAAIQFITDPQNRAVLREEIKAGLMGMMNHTRIVEDMSDADLDGFAMSILTGTGANHSFRENVLRNDRSLSIIITPFLDSTKEEIAAGIANVPNSAVKNVPGTDMEWRIKVLAHEVAHAANQHAGPSLSAETIADAESEDIYQYERERGTVQTASIHDYYMHARAVGSVMHFEPDTHQTNGPLRSGKEGPPPKGTEAEFVKGLDFLKEKVTNYIGTVHMGMTHFAVPLHNILNYQPTIEGAEVLVLTASDEKIIGDMLKLLADPSKSQDFEALVQKLSPEVESKIEDILKTQRTGMGSFLAQHNAPLLYKSAAELYKLGAFEENDIAQQYAYEFLVGAEIVAPEHFAVQNVPDRNFTPPVFTDEGTRVVQLPAMTIIGGGGGPSFGR